MNRYPYTDYKQPYTKAVKTITEIFCQRKTEDDAIIRNIIHSQ